MQTRRTRRSTLETTHRRVIARLAASADGYIARPDGDIEWLTSRPAPAGFYGYDAFVRTIDTKLLGRRTYEEGLRLGAKFDAKSPTYVFSRRAPPADVPAGVEFVSDEASVFLSRLRERPGKDIWLMGGGELIASFLDARAVDALVVNVVPVLIGDGIPLIARRHRHVTLTLDDVERFENGVVQVHYRIENAARP